MIDFVNKKHIKELYKLGFDENVLKPNKSLPMFHITSMKKAIKEGGGPTYSQAFKWLLKNHLTYGVIKTANVSISQGNDYYLEIVEPPDEHGISKIYTAEPFISYEEAEKFLLEELIRIIKSNEKQK